MIRRGFEPPFALCRRRLVRRLHINWVSKCIDLRRCLPEKCCHSKEGRARLTSIKKVQARKVQIKKHPSPLYFIIPSVNTHARTFYFLEDTLLLYMYAI